MKISKKPVLSLLFFTGVILLLVLLMQPWQILHFQNAIAILFPKGIVAIEELNLLLVIQGLMLLVILPVYVLTFLFSWRYRAGNSKAVYDPDLVDHKVAEYLWWGIPLAMTMIIGGLTWAKTYQLDPFKPLPSMKKEITVQVVALQWKWLFIYPEEKIASLNFLQIPKDTPIHFEITADAPMNSFWIPSLGGQIYAMPNMKTELYLMANEEGDFRGSSANLSGEGFAGMHFITRASSQEEFQAWITSAKKGQKNLDLDTYHRLANPSQADPPQLYQLKEENLFDQILMKHGG